MVDGSPLLNRVTLDDVAREAGVGVATVDRVLNKRPNVHARTVDKVEEAIRRLNYRRHPAAAHLARQRTHRIAFLLPEGDNRFVAMLREHIEANRPWLADRRALVTVQATDAFAPQAVADALLGLRNLCDCAVVMAIDHPLVRAAIDELADAGVGVITLVSDVPASRRMHFVGVDNVAAGRTAASLTGRFLGEAGGPVAVIAGSLSLRDHAERWLGFRQVLQAEYPALHLLEPREGRDDSTRTEGIARALCEQHPDLRAIYNIGAGNEGVSRALLALGRARSMVFVGHDLTPETRRDLLTGTMDAVINQDPAHEVRSALRLAMAPFTHESVQPDQERIRLDIYLRDNLP